MLHARNKSHLAVDYMMFCNDACLYIMHPKKGELPFHNYVLQGGKNNMINVFSLSFNSVLNVGAFNVFKLKMNISLEAIVAISISQMIDTMFRNSTPFLTVSHYAPEKR